MLEESTGSVHNMIDALPFRSGAIAPSSLIVLRESFGSETEFDDGSFLVSGDALLSPLPQPITKVKTVIKTSAIQDTRLLLMLEFLDLHDFGFMSFLLYDGGNRPGHSPLTASSPITHTKKEKVTRRLSFRYFFSDPKAIGQ